MKKLINLIALVMLVSTNVLTPFSYAQEETPEVIPENEVENVEEIGETPERDNEITGEIPNSLWEVEWEWSLPLVREVVNESEPEGLKEEVEDSLDAVESLTIDENKDEDTEKSQSDEVAQQEEENTEGEKQEKDLEWDEVEDDFSLQKEDETMIMQVQSWTTATLLPWPEFKEIITKLAGWSNAINQIVRASSISSWVSTTGIAAPYSDKVIVAWFDDGIIYYYTEAETIYMNPDSSHMFSYMQWLTWLDLSGWDTSNVTNMWYMFQGCTKLTNLDISNFDTSNVTSMHSMFEFCYELKNLDFSGRITSKVNDMAYMFRFCTSLTWLDLSSLDTSNVTNMYYMFSTCSELEELNLSGWDFRKYRSELASNLNLPWSTSLKKINLTNAKFSWSMYQAFRNLKNLEEIILDNVDTSNVTNMRYMFSYCSSLTWLDLSSFDTSNVTDMSSMFYDCDSLTWLDLSSFDTSNVTDMSSIFAWCDLLDELNLSGWDFSQQSGFKIRNLGIGPYDYLKKLNMTNAKFSWSMNKAFGSQYLGEIILDGVDTSNVTDMSNMFDYSINLRELNLSSFDTSNVTNMEYMFRDCRSLTALDLSSFDTSNVTDMSSIFAWCDLLDELNLSGWDFRKYRSSYLMDYLFNGKQSQLKKLDMTNTKYTWDAAYAFKWLTNLEELKLEWADTSCVTHMQWMFNGDSKLTWLDLSSFDTSNVTDMYQMFYNCSGLIWLDLSGFNTSNIKFMEEMFRGCSGLIWLNLSNFDTSNVVNMFSMFYGCSNLTGLDLGNWDTRNVTNMWGIFGQCSNLEKLNLSGWDFSKFNYQNFYWNWRNAVALQDSLKYLNMQNTKFSWSMNYAFGWLAKLEKLKLDWVDTSNVTNMSNMFAWCTNLTELDLSSFDTSNVTGMSYMFSNCMELLELNLSGWDFSNLSTKFSSSMLSLSYGVPLKKWNMQNAKFSWSMNYAFGWLTKLEELKLDWVDTSNVTNMGYMFQNCSNLTWIDVSNFDTSNVTNMSSMFYGCSGLNKLDLSSFDTIKVKDMASMFYNTPNLNTIYASDKFVTEDVTYYGSMFTNDISLIWWNGTKFDSWYIDKTYALIDKPWQTWYFTDKNAITVKFINTLDWTETTSTFAKWQKITPPYVDKYHVVWWYLDEAMTQKIDLNKWVDSYTVIYVKYDRNGSSGWWGGGWSSKKTDEDTHWSAEDSQKNTQDDKNTENVIQSETKWSEESSNTHVDSSDKSSEWQEILSPSDSPSSAGQVSFTKEQKDAYTFAKENWITTKDTIQSAQMNGKLTRIAMAKMLSQYAINVLWQTPDTSKTIKFKDVSNKKDADYDNWVTLAYQLWIMWQNMPWNKFRPNDEVSRAEFATALSRLLYQTTDWKYKSTKEYYIPHMAKLYNEWIISNTDPSMAERRWYVMIMLMRGAK